MNTTLLDFCNLYKKKLVNDKDIKENKLDIFTDFRERINFKIYCTEIIPHSFPSIPFGYRGKQLITLDEEDLKYLYDKYSKQIVTELELNINNLKQQYETENN